MIISTRTPTTSRQRVSLVLPCRCRVSHQHALRTDICLRIQRSGCCVVEQITHYTNNVVHSAHTWLTLCVGLRPTSGYLLVTPLPVFVGSTCWHQRRFPGWAKSVSWTLSFNFATISDKTRDDIYQRRRIFSEIVGFHGNNNIKNLTFNCSKSNSSWSRHGKSLL